MGMCHGLAHRWETLYKTGNIPQLLSLSSHFPLGWVLGAASLSLLPLALLPLRTHTGLPT